MILAIDVQPPIDDLMVERFHEKTLRVGNCLEWQGEVDRDGYGKYPVCRRGVKRRWMAHRFAVLLAQGFIEEGHEVDHLCRNRRCVEPSHLEAVSPRENHDRWSTAITHCPRGHEYTKENTHLSRRGARVCRACKRERAREAYWRDPEKARARVREASRR